MARTLDKETQEIQRLLENKRCCKLNFDDPQTFQVDKILNVRAISTEIEYLVKWTGYSAKHNEWVAEKYVSPKLKKVFSQERKKKEIKRLKKDQQKRTSDENQKNINSVTATS